MNRLLLILDLDETLVHATTRPLSRPAPLRFAEYHVYQRPGLEEFLSSCRSHFDLAIWTSSGATYAESVVRHVMDPSGLEFLWSRDRCTPRLDPFTQGHCWIKDLKKVKKRGYALSRALVVDDTPAKAQRNYGNYVRVLPFEGDPADTELAALARYLLTLRDVPDVREVEKRGWRNGTAPRRLLLRRTASEDERQP